MLKTRIIDIALGSSILRGRGPFAEGDFQGLRPRRRLIEDAFGDFWLGEGGRPDPVECFFMPPGVRDTALKVACTSPSAAPVRGTGILSSAGLLSRALCRTAIRHGFIEALNLGRIHSRSTSRGHRRRIGNLLVDFGLQ